MPTYSNAGYNNPALGQAFGNIASLFAGPTPQEQLVAQTLKAQQATAAQKAAALGRQSPDFQDAYNLENGDPTSISKFFQVKTALDPTSTLSSQDKMAYAGTQQAGNTIGGRQANMQVAQGSQVFVPAGVLGPNAVTLSNDKPDAEPSLDTTKAGFLKAIATDPTSPAASNARIALAALGGSSPQTVINNGAAESSEAAARGKAAADGFAAMQTQAAAAPDKIARLKLLNGVLQNTRTGPLSGAAGTVVGIANQLGISPDTIKGLGLDPNQAVDNSIAGKLAGEMVMGSIGAKNGGFPASNFSVAERQFIENTFPNLMAQPGANQTVTDVMSAVEQRKIDKAAEYQQYAAQQKAAGKYPDFEGFEQGFQQKHAQDNVFAPILQKYQQGDYSPPAADAPQIAPNARSPYGAPPAPMAAPAPAPAGGASLSPFNANGPVAAAPPAYGGAAAVPAPPPAAAGRPAIPPAAAAALKANPARRAEFEQLFGPGTAASVLGQ